MLGVKGRHEHSKWRKTDDAKRRQVLLVIKHTLVKVKKNHWIGFVAD